ncbi:GL20231 [Drosophila persimilis]|uniref:GL20231 n=1 Tax=Drosophila persimilis TaxID=7234 RepID=B4GXP5_DROPE|nr:SUMO-conjugating enzyme UBC9-B [Drosophila persimilis]EDW27522.1 GL20231 [Drosophila persimilis]
MSEYALNRLIEERKQWQQLPLYGFTARPTKLIDGSVDYMTWDCIVPVERGMPPTCLRYCVQLSFDIHYPASMPKVLFEYPILHPNVDWMGYMTMPDFNPDMPSTSLSIEKILLTVQSMIDKPNMNDFTKEQIEYWFAVDPDFFHVEMEMKAVVIAEADSSTPNHKRDDEDMPEQKMNQISESKNILMTQMQINN